MQITDNIAVTAHWTLNRNEDSLLGYSFQPNIEFEITTEEGLEIISTNDFHNIGLGFFIIQFIKITGVRNGTDK
jgi:hypothetical protein